MSNISGSSGPLKGTRAAESAAEKKVSSSSAVNNEDEKKMKDAMSRGGVKLGGKGEGSASALGRESSFSGALEKGASKDKLAGMHLKDTVMERGSDKKSKGKDGRPGEGAMPVGQQVQAQSSGPLGQAASVAGAESAQAPSASVKEMADLAGKMVDRMLATDAKENLGRGSEVRMTFGDSNPNLKGVEVVLKKDGESLNIQFNTANPDAKNYISQNEGALRNNLKELNVSDIKIDIPDSQSDTGGEPRESRGEYIPEEDPNA